MPAVSSSNNINIRKKQRCRDGVMNEFLFWCRHPLVPLLFHEVTSLNPFISEKMIFHLSMYFSVWGKAPIKMRCEDIDAAMCLMVSELKKRHNDRQKQKNSYIAIKRCILHRAPGIMHPVCTFVGALVTVRERGVAARRGVLRMKILLCRVPRPNVRP